MRFILFALCFFVSAGLYAQPLQVGAQRLLDRPVLTGAWWGGLALYQKSEQTLFDVNGDTRLTPASSLKLLTTAAALELLGPLHRFSTRLYAQAEPDADGTVKGNLYLRGGGDMTLGSTRVRGSESSAKILQRWVNAIEQAGIRRVEGALVADVSLFDGPMVAPKVNWGNMGNYFAAPASALSFNDNLFEIHFAPQPLPNAPAQVAFILPQIDALDLQSFVLTDGKSNKDEAYVYGAPDQYLLKIFGTIPVNTNGFTIKGAMPNPALYTVQALRRALEEKGITFSQEPRVSAAAADYGGMLLLDTHFSPPLRDIIWVINKRSFNLYADTLLRHLALAQGKTGSVDNGVKALTEFLQKNLIAREQDMVIYDGSGLSRDNMVTPRVLVNTLNFMAQSPHFEDYSRSLTTADDRGDLMLLRPFLRMQNKMQDVRVKAGTLDGVKALAGYTRDAQGRLVSFAFIANNLLPETNESLFRIHEELIKLLMRHTASPAEQTPPAAQVAPEEKTETDAPLVQTPAVPEEPSEPTQQAPVLQEEPPAQPAVQPEAAVGKVRNTPKINPKKKRRKTRFPPGPRPKPGPLEEEPAPAPVPEEPQAPAIILVGAEDLPDEQMPSASDAQEPPSAAEPAAQAPEQVLDVPAP